ncbi:prenyltransferase [Salimicrobium salexigens]|uniref:1,4-dihydroxy-2-naphthoate octaprenyltransferase n=1 Tax=Salimicrobium salexigens TaxID=908941 RepID=A0ABY1KU07_9BACI|nr:prenyltransferase [Salimicrobium salexigens]SIS69270.1 1,4-dihydroxy-2-naphthoate octaprenyltransferase [Salimicrobium salexigens]
MNVPSLFRTAFTLVRLIAVLFSSFAAIIATILPMYLYYSYSAGELTLVLLLLLAGALLIHGFLTHVLNDYADSMSGTDDKSPGILSGGSRIIQNNLVTAGILLKIGIISIIVILTAGIVLFFSGYIKIAVLLLIGLWSSITYSMSPLRLGYYPLVGEWFSMFPAVFFIGFAGPWIVMESPPLWAYQNALLIALFTQAWVMVHHIPDRFADENASPPKITTVVWMKNKFGDTYSRAPALLYFLLCSLCAFWIFMERPVAGAGAAVLSFASVFIVLQLNLEDNEDVSQKEKMLLILTMTAALWTGLFI